MVEKGGKLTPLPIGLGNTYTQTHANLVKRGSEELPQLESLHFPLHVNSVKVKVKEFWTSMY